MNHCDCLKYIVLVLLCLLASAPSSVSAESQHNYSNKEFGFGFQYPASWGESPPLALNARVKLVSPVGSPHAECTVIVKRYPHADSAKQSDIDQVFTARPSVAELKEILSQGASDVDVLEAGTGKLHSRPAHLARVRYITGTLFGNAYASGRVVMTATPGLTWTLSCSGQGATPAEAEKSYQSWQGEIDNIASSFRFK